MSDAAVLALVALSLMAAACRGGPAVRQERGAGNDPAELADNPRAPEIDDRYRHSAEDPAASDEVVSVEEEPGEPEEPPELDLAVRVKNAYGYPAECLGPDAVDEGVGEFSIRLSVTMTATGTVTRSSVYAPVSGEALACLERRAERLRVAGPIEDAPRTVSTSIDVQAVDRLAAARSTPTESEPEEVVPPGDVEPPSNALPAVAGDGPAPGSVPADHTLPAVVGEGPAAGSVEADVVLPARGASDGRGWTWISGSAEARGEVAEEEE